MGILSQNKVEIKINLCYKKYGDDMKKLFIFFLIILVGCTNNETIIKSNDEIIESPKEELKLKENLDFEYAEKVYLYDLS